MGGGRALPIGAIVQVRSIGALLARVGRVHAPEHVRYALAVITGELACFITDIELFGKAIGFVRLVDTIFEVVTPPFGGDALARLAAASVRRTVDVLYRVEAMYEMVNQSSGSSLPQLISSLLS